VSISHAGLSSAPALPPHGRVVLAAAIRRAYLWYEVLALCTGYMFFVVWQGFGVSGVPQLFGERATVPGAGPPLVCPCAGGATKPATSSSGMTKRINAS
jgi:hypothetical protein